MGTRKDGTLWWTFEEAQAYLGLKAESAQVWLSRHHIRGQRVYSAKEIRRARDRNR